MVAAQKGETDIDQAERQWQSINNILGGIELTTYLRHFWNSRNMIARKQNLFKVVKNSIIDADQAFALLDELENNAAFTRLFLSQKMNFGNRLSKAIYQAIEIVRRDPVLASLVGGL